MWHTTVPSPELLVRHGPRGIWLLRRKKAPPGWSKLSPAQRSRTQYRREAVFGWDELIILIRTYVSSVNGEWRFEPVLEKRIRGPCSDLTGYEWCPLNSQGDRVELEDPNAIDP